MYPGAAGPLASNRLINLADGIEDLQLFQQLGLDATSISNADDLITLLVRNMTARTGNPVLLEQVRRQAARRVLAQQARESEGVLSRTMWAAVPTKRESTDGESLSAAPPLITPPRPSTPQKTDDRSSGRQRWKQDGASDPARSADHPGMFVDPAGLPLALAPRPKKCSCANATLCRPLAHGPPAHADVHVWSDCGGPWQTWTEAGNTTCNWRDLDFDTITTLGRDVGHSLGVRDDGSVSVGGFGNWPDSDLVCHAHAHDVRVISAVHPYLDQIYPKSKRPSDPCFYYKLLSNSTAHLVLARDLLTAIKDAGMDGVEFDFEGISRDIDAECSPGFDYGTAHVAMVKTVADTFHAALPHSTVTLTMGGSNISDAIHAPYLSAYPVPGLAVVSDGIFIM